MTYQMRAYQYIKAMFEYVNDWHDWNDILEATEKTFWHTGKHASVECGSARMVIIGKDFAVKWDYDECVSKIGGCEDEFQKYKVSLSSKYSYLLAPVFRFSYREHYFYVMPKATGIGSHKDIKDFIKPDEYEWLINHVGDLHSWNWGILNGKPIVIDYACEPHKQPYYLGF
jgi:hypothetical protein